ncbi:fructan beta-fructosidase [Spirosomataceae bacterium TFI 002]|nr:fructan beta-fructosidase [Spirosomataceae bacterium TFI 002]
MARFTLIFFLISYSLQSFSQERWRPEFHFSPEKNWMNDPNGLVYLNGEWHLFFQHNPLENKWGHMSWGHAVSHDLLNWTELEVAIPEGEEEWIFSGSVVNDKNNTSGFFEDNNGLVAIYTADYHGKLENQHLAYSKDNGRTWVKYAGNPIIPQAWSAQGSLGELKEFRDPNIFWHQESEKWIMAVVLPKQYKVQFYSSTNLKTWKWESDFGGVGDMRKIWECPGMTKVPIYDVDGKQIDFKWLLMVSSSGPDDGYTGMQYFTGNFDGKTFSPDNEQWPKYLDHGKDFYAAIPFNNTSKSLILGWFSNWKYAQKPPTNAYKGQMSIVRELSFVKNRDGVTLRQRPVVESQNWNKVLQMEQMPLSSSNGIDWRTQSRTYRLQMTFEVNGSDNFGLKILVGENEQTVISYNPNSQEISLDRTQSGHSVDLSFPSIERAFCPLIRNRLTLDILVDNSMVEVFANDGQVVISDLVFPETDAKSWKIFGNENQGKLMDISVWEWEK